jgi:viroplasmin and RNaseH domain-containing protein
MTIYKTIKTIEEAENVLKEKYNIVLKRPEKDEEYISCLMKEIIEEEDKRILSIIEEILRG